MVKTILASIAAAALMAGQAAAAPVERAATPLEESEHLRGGGLLIIPAVLVLAILGILLTTKDNDIPLSP